MENILSGISKGNHHLISCPQTKKALDLCVASLGQSQGVDRCYIFKNKIKNGDLKLYYVHEWCNDSVTPYINDPLLSGLGYDDFPGLFETLSKDEALYGNVRESKNDLFKEIMTMQNIKSYLFTPIMYEKKFWGWIGYDNCKDEKKWLQSEVTALHTVAKNIGLRLNQDKKAKKLKKNLNFLENYIKGTKQAASEYNVKKRTAKFSSACGSLLGYEEHEIEHHYNFWKNHIHPEDIEDQENKFNDFINIKTANYEGIVRMIHKNNHTLHIKYSGTKIFNKKGKLLKVICTHIDLSELIKQKNELKKSEEKYRFIAENTSDIICHHTNCGKIIYISNSSKEILGYNAEELINKNPFDYIYQYDKWIFRKETNRNNLKSNRKTATFRFQKKDGNFIWLESIISPIIVDSNHTGYQSASRDITERMKAAQETKAALLKEKKFNDLKSKFVSMASHQFRTPLTVIYSNAELIEMKASVVNNDYHSKIISVTDRIKAEVDRMTELMNNILIFGKHELSKSKTELKPIDYTEFIENIIKVYFSNEDDGRKIKLIVNGNRKDLITDETLILHIFTNLISNAFKYSKNCPEPIIELTYLDSSIKIEVIDFGIGIPEDELKQLFTSFYRASNTTTIIGSGLGLTIVKQFTEQLKGSIELESIENIKTKFTLFFPYDQN
jgi:PAS domain S-box-containing protein